MVKKKHLTPKTKTKTSALKGAKSAAYKAHGNKAPKAKKDMKHKTPSTTASSFKGRKGKDNSTVKNAS